MTDAAGGRIDGDRKSASDLFVVSLLALYAELIVIRWLASEVRVFAYFKNLPLMASFLGLGLGMLVPGARRWKRAFPLLFAAVAIPIAYADALGLVHLRFPDSSVAMWNLNEYGSLRAAIAFLVIILLIFMLVVAAFSSIGSRLAELFDRFTPLRAYSINVAGSLAGIALFTVLSLGEAGPIVWLGILAIPVLWLDRTLLAASSLACLLGVVALAPQADHWSPYYRIDLAKRRVTYGGQEFNAGWTLSVNHDYHQRALDLSDAFLKEHPVLLTNPGYREALQAYSLPHQAMPGARSVLVVGAGTGNDVAAALRAGATHVDAAEIDPRILEIGRTLHPERPYADPRVRTLNVDARAWFRQSHERYDLIVFGLLDSHTMFSSLSSLRLDNYVYTVESFREAIGLLRPGGALAISFAKASGDWLAQRMINTLRAASGQEPFVVYNGYDKGATYFAGPGLPQIRERLEGAGLVGWRAGPGTPADVRPATDLWPFLYIRPGARPTAYVTVLGAILLAAFLLVRRGLHASGAAGTGFDWLLFFMGAGFMLVEVKSVAELSLLFGSTWLVNSAVFTGILVMILGANAFVARRPRIRRWPWIGLGLSLLLPVLLPLSSLNALSFPTRAALGSLLASLPIFFSGLLFATLFRDHPHPSAGLAANLLGAMVGGVLEYSSMLFGIPALNIVGLAVYSLAFWVSLRGRPREAIARRRPPL